MKRKIKKAEKTEEDIRDIEQIEEENAVLFTKLTKKNEDYMIKLSKRLSDESFPGEKQTRIFNEMLKELVSGQAAGRTARQIYGPVTNQYLEITDGRSPADKGNSPEVGERSEDWKLYVDGALMLGGMFALVTGLSGLLSKQNATGSMGVLTLILNFIIGGFVVVAITKNVPVKGQKGGLLRYSLVSIVAMLIWIAAMTVSMALIPQGINPILSPIANVIIGAVAFGGKIYFKRKFNVKGTLF